MRGRAMQIKRTLTFIDEVTEEAGQRIDPPLRKVAVAAIIRNPFAGHFEQDLKLLTTVFGNVMREAAGGGKAWISSLTKRAAPGAAIDIPLAHKDALYVRSHYDGVTVLLPDAPLPDELAIICAFASRGRPNHRV